MQQWALSVKGARRDSADPTM